MMKTKEEVLKRLWSNFALFMNGKNVQFDNRGEYLYYNKDIESYFDKLK